MNKSKLKSYAPQARNDFIAMVTSRANQLGISEAGGQLQIESCTVQGDVALIGGQAYPAKVAQLCAQNASDIVARNSDLGEEGRGYVRRCGCG